MPLGEEFWFKIISIIVVSISFLQCKRAAHSSGPDSLGFHSEAPISLLMQTWADCHDVFQAVHRPNNHQGYVAPNLHDLYFFIVSNIKI